MDEMNRIKINDQPLYKGDNSGERIVVERNSPNKNETPTFRGSTKLASSLSRVAFVLIDINAKKKWVNRLAGHKLVEGDIFGMEYKTYEHYDLAWPISDREYVLEAQWTTDLVGKFPSAKLAIRSTTHKDYPIRKDRIRGDLQKLVFYIKELAPQTTEATVEIKVDPKGKMPPLLANLIQKNWPLTTLRALNKALNQGEEEHEMFK